MNCPTCGATLTDGTTTCPTCGAAISQPADFNQMQYNSLRQTSIRRSISSLRQTIISNHTSSLRQITIRCHMQILLAQDSSGNSMPDILQ